ncbi:MAG: hypothetical protein LCH30_11850 [Proteobacteria bacterium]|nr:hypothetical protein [Pseudomonadota bacterium]
MTGISKERMQKALEQEKNISEEDFAKVKALACMIKMPRSFIFKTPDEYGMENWIDLSISSADGTPLEAGGISCRRHVRGFMGTSCQKYPHFYVASAR